MWSKFFLLELEKVGNQIDNFHITFNARKGYKFNILKVNAISQKMKYAKLNKFLLKVMGKLKWDFFFCNGGSKMFSCGTTFMLQSLWN